MATAAGPLPIYSSPDVHNFYIKQKNEFHFQQKSDNEFLMFLLDTAVRVISIVQHLAPVIEAVSDASVEADEIEDMSPAATPAPATGSMDTSINGSLATELEQISQEITSNSQITSKRPVTYQHRPNLPPEPMQTSPTAISASQAYTTPSQPQFSTQSSTVSHTPVPNVTVPPTSAAIPTPASTLAHPSASQPIAPAHPDPLAPNIPSHQIPSSAQISENLPTDEPSVMQPVAEAQPDPSDETNYDAIYEAAYQPNYSEPSYSEPNFKSEGNVPEIIEIKEEDDDDDDSGMLSHRKLNNLMSSISGTEDATRIQNFVPTATPSSLPPKFLVRNFI
jgi:hypothetical protein